MILRQMLYRCEIRFLPVIAGFWLNLQRTPNYEELIRMLCGKMTDPGILRKMLVKNEGKGIPTALSHLTASGGTETAEKFESLFGTFRIAGLEKILREKYWLSPVSVTEELWYRGMIFREIREVGGELKDCYILPDDLREILSGLLPKAELFVPEDTVLTVRPAVPAETTFVHPVSENIPDLFCLAAALRRGGKPFTLPGFDMTPARVRFTEMLLNEGGFFSADNEADSEKLRRTLIQNRTAAQIELVRIWRNSGRYAELSEDSGHLTVNMAPDFDPEEPRGKILKLLSGLKTETWWSISGFVSAVKMKAPNFLRASFGENRGQILDKDGNDLSGIGGWYQLEGAYIRFLLNGPLSWLGIVQTASGSRSETEGTGFRILPEGLFYLAESAQAETTPGIRDKPNLEQGTPKIAADGAVICGRDVPRYFRYMAARFCEIEKYKADICTFRITPSSLADAESSGISREAVLQLLQRFCGKAIPPALERMLSKPALSSLPATIYQATILTIPDTGMISELLHTARLEKWILQQLNPNSLLIDPKGIEDIRRFLMENEIFVDIQKKG